MIDLYENLLDFNNITIGIFTILFLSKGLDIYEKTKYLNYTC